MITLDTSGVVALINSRDQSHETVAETLLGQTGPYLVPALIMAEITYLISTKGNPRLEDLFLADIETGDYVLESGQQDIGRIRHQMRRYADMPLGFADAAVVACAERNGGKVLTLDHRHFGVLARDAGITILP